MKRQREEIFGELQAKRAKYMKIEDEEAEIKSDIEQLKYELNTLIGINRFPNELMGLILDRLEASDLLACERVCRRWNGFVKEFARGELIISELNERRPKKWKFPKKACSPKRTIVRSDLQFEDLASSFLIELKRLKIINNKVRRNYNRFSLLNDLHFVNKLQNLEVLEVSSIQFESEGTLTLPHLRCLAVSLLESKLKLATPELSSYHGQSVKKIEFVFKEKVTHLHLDKYHADCKHLNNLQYLALKNDGIPGELVWTQNGHLQVGQWSIGEFLNDHPNLKELSIRPSFDRLNEDTYLSAESKALQVLEQKKSLKREDFHLIFLGVQLENAEQLAAFRYPHRGGLARLHLLNHSTLCTKELRWVKRIDLGGLLKCVSDGLVEEISPDFYEKFDHVEEIVIPYGLAEEHIDVLKKFKDLNSLIVQNNPELETSWNLVSIFEKIADELPQIWSLQFDDLYNQERNSLDIAFKFKELGRIRVTEVYCWSFHRAVPQLFAKYDMFGFNFVENVTELMISQRSKHSALELWKKVDYRDEPARWLFHDEFSCVQDLYEEIESKFAD